ncbi:hypothetical protein BABINDRAFT_161384 [Babjeviella inositovora NRRL Y-12698]|uniref:Uncharacterized protein n=1 Tax=Babjeviella inositovora NRRL Y-12698 TaxID=984486 RepID=A0A1E3QRX6_9ASCO|nr:uncharacterized protein BABINDRAFT_161384 [Babjeviella inositovora NRRL Y-12698]ODQ80445.1 hypothetical protein BABINDRAFT_161384 [Babjeviella inositovora NRRL Y-12698]
MVRKLGADGLLVRSGVFRNTTGLPANEFISLGLLGDIPHASAAILEYVGNNTHLFKRDFDAGSFLSSYEVQFKHSPETGVATLVIGLSGFTPADTNLSSNTALQKRDSSNLMSYNWDNSNEQLWDQHNKDSGWINNAGNDVANWVVHEKPYGNYVWNKWCACFDDNQRQTGANVDHGEFYIGGYGGIDGGCNADDCGWSEYGCNTDSWYDCST